MTPKEYYKSTRSVDTNQWTLEMALAFAEEYHKFCLQKQDPDEDKFLNFPNLQLELFEEPIKQK